jgi:hypothetical protein
VVFTGGNGPAVLVASGPAAMVAHRGKEAWATRLGVGSNAPRLAGPAAERYDLEGDARCVWKGQRPRTAPCKASGGAFGGGRQVGKSDRKWNKWIGQCG